MGTVAVRDQLGAEFTSLSDLAVSRESTYYFSGRGLERFSISQPFLLWLSSGGIWGEVSVLAEVLHSSCSV